MIPISGRPIVGAAAMRAAEEAAMAGGTTVDALMARAGAGVAAAVRRLAGAGEILVLCGPGNNGGDGYVAAAMLRAAGRAVRVAASGDPRTPAAIRARAGWEGPVEPIDTAAPAPVLVDGLFGTGLSRPLPDATAAALARLDAGAALTIAIDVPSGIATDDGAILSPARADVTLALGAPKPCHLLQPGAAACGAVRLIDIGVAVESPDRVLSRPSLSAPGADDHKYSRGMVAVIAGAMPGAAALAATAAAHLAGYVLLIGSSTDRLPHAIVRRRWSAAALDDRRIGAILVGPGLGRDEGARDRLSAALASDRPLVIDGDALHLLDAAALRGRGAATILTPHAGEFAALFGTGAGSRLERARAAAADTGATIVLKGADTIVAQPDGATRIAEAAPAWLASAGTGDVLAGIVAARLAAGAAPLAAAGAAVWLHGEAARRAGPAFLADALPDHLPAAIGACL